MCIKIAYNVIQKISKRDEHTDKNVLSSHEVRFKSMNFEYFPIYLENQIKSL